MAKKSTRRRRKEDKINGTQREPRKSSVRRHLANKVIEPDFASTWTNPNADKIIRGESELASFSFDITHEPLDEKAIENWSEETIERASEVYVEMNTPRLFYKGTINKLKPLIAENPDHLPFRNWLINLYELSKKERKALRLAEELYEEHPDYLFSRIKLATFLMNPGRHFDLDRADQLLGGTVKMLQTLAPERDLFHTSEVIHYHLTAAQYHCLTNEPDKFDFCKRLVVYLAGEESGEANMLSGLEENWDAFAKYGSANKLAQVA